MTDDLTTRARTMLLSTDEPTLLQQVWAFRLLAPVSPAVYRPKLTRALVRLSDSVREEHAARHALLSEALEAADGLHPDNPDRYPALHTALDALQTMHSEFDDHDQWLTLSRHRVDLARSSGGPAFLAGALYALATALAGCGRFGEAADALHEQRRVLPPTAWDRDRHLPQLSALMSAAGRPAEAHLAYGEHAARLAAAATESDGHPVLAVRALIQHARLLDRDGRPGDAGRARGEAASHLRRLAAVADQRSYTVDPDGCADQLMVAADPSQPAFFLHDGFLTSRARRAVADRLADLRQRVDRLGPLAEADPATHLRPLVDLHRRLTAATALGITARITTSHGWWQLDPVLPLADGTVALAELLTAHGLDPDGSRLAEALLDRACLLTTLRRPTDALADLTRAGDRPAPPADPHHRLTRAGD